MEGYPRYEDYQFTIEDRYRFSKRYAWLIDLARDLGYDFSKDKHFDENGNCFYDMIANESFASGMPCMPDEYVLMQAECFIYDVWNQCLHDGRISNLFELRHDKMLNELIEARKNKKEEN